MIEELKFLQKVNCLDSSGRFSDFADVLLNRSNLVVNHQKFKITEIEFYLYSEEHPDVFTHCSDFQSKFAE